MLNSKQSVMISCSPRVHHRNPVCWIFLVPGTGGCCEVLYLVLWNLIVCNVTLSLFITIYFRLIKTCCEISKATTSNELMKFSVKLFSHYYLQPDDTENSTISVVLWISSDITIVILLLKFLNLEVFILVCCTLKYYNVQTGDVNLTSQ